MTWQAAINISFEMVAVNNGFDLKHPASSPWRGFASTQAALRIWLAAESKENLLLALSQRHVAEEMGGFSSLPGLPEGAVWARAYPSIHELGAAVRRAFKLSKTLPDELLQAFTRQTSNLPRATEAERLVVQRVGQTVFRDGLIDYWQGRCALTGLAVPELLRASHIKPWADCATDAERLDVFNGLLLAPHLDAVFDRGFITLDNEGRVQISPALPANARVLLGLDGPLQVAIKDGHRHYLPWHRDRVFRD